MSGVRDDRETLVSETSLASDDTIQADSQGSSGSLPPSSSVIRQGRASAPRTKLGRYTLGAVRGRGGMGQVYEAEDPELGRRVAIKVLREGRGDTSTLLREAQALAKLVHPNVITIHDVGSEDGSVFLVMHLVDGESIDHWLKGRNAGPREVIAAFRQAGLGLAAAHAAGLVHCDFKPSNVLVDAEGVVRVGDFGLARGAGDSGQIAGTPAYMAPEQFAGEATPASDQFAFCVALWEVLAGEPPFARGSLDDGEVAAANRERRPMPRGKHIPARVLRALERGLSPVPSDRFPSMQDLLHALSPPRGKGIAIGAGLALAAAVGGIAFVAGRGGPPAGPVAAPKAEPLPPRLDLARAHPLTKLGREACAYAPSIMADGTVVFDRTEHDAVDLYALPIAGGSPRQLTSQAPWEWRSSRGLREGEILYLSHNLKQQSASTINSLDLATGKQSSVIDVFAHDVATGGGSVFYIPITQLQLRRWTHGQDVTLISGATVRFRQVAASSAGDRLAVVASNGAGLQLCLVDVASAKLECFDRPVKNARPAFGVDGNNVYYATAEGIRRREIATGKDEIIDPDARAIGGLAVSPDGSSLVFSECGAQSRVIDAAAPDHVIVDDPSAGQPATGPDGLLAWTHDVRGVRVLAVRTKSGKEIQLTGPELGSVQGPSFSPDGHAVAFTGTAPHGGIHKAQIQTDTYIEQVTDVATDAFPVFADANRIAFVRFDTGNIPTVYIVPVDGGDPVRFGKASRMVVGARKRELLAMSSTRMFWIDSKTGAERPGPEHPASTSDVAISPSGNWVGFTAGQAGQELWRISVDPPGKLEHVMSLPTGQTGTTIAITDEGHILIAPQTWSGDLVVVPAAPGSRL